MNTLPPAKFQIGKNGITQGTLDSLSLVFKNHKHVRISVLIRQKQRINRKDGFRISSLIVKKRGILLQLQNNWIYHNHEQTSQIRKNLIAGLFLS